jgi:hypothetical protein
MNIPTQKWILIIKLKKYLKAVVDAQNLKTEFKKNSFLFNF